MRAFVREVLCPVMWFELVTIAAFVGVILVVSP
jgi:hypothetical protein